MLRQKWIDFADRQAESNKPYRKFHSAIKTRSTKSTYAYNMQRFMNFLVERHEIDSDEDYDPLEQFEGDKITDLLEDFVFALNKKLKPSGISTMLAAPELFFEMNRKTWHRKLVRRGIKREDVELGGKIPATDDDIAKMLSVTNKLRDKAIIHFLASTGSRPAGVSDPVLRMKHLADMPQGCKAIKIYDKSKKGYKFFYR